MATTTATQHSITLPHGLGLLTTVASLPPKYRVRYLNIKTKCEIPLDLSVKQISPQIANDVPIPANFTEVYTEPSSEPETQTSELGFENYVASIIKQQQSPIDSSQQQQQKQPQKQQQKQQLVDDAAIVAITKISKITTTKPITPPLTPTACMLAKRKYDELITDDAAEKLETQTHTAALKTQPLKMPKIAEQPTSVGQHNTKCERTPNKPIKVTDSPPKTIKSQLSSTKSTRNKATRKLKFDEETSSPVSGTIIRPLEDITDGTVQYSNGDIDPKYNIVEVTEETKAELAAIKNVIGDYVCKLCRLKFDDAFGLARHRCACIVLLEYRCPECGKQFNCPANLASHRRWHKPKKESAAAGSVGGNALAKKENRNTMNQTAMPGTNIQQNQQQQTMKTTKVTDDFAYACSECGKKFKRQAYLRKHLLTHENAKKTQASDIVDSSNVAGDGGVVVMLTQTQASSLDDGISSSTAVGSYKSYASSSSTSSMHSYSGIHEDEHNMYTVATTTSAYVYDNTNTNANSDLQGDGVDDGDGDDVADTISDYSTSSSAGYGRLQIVESGLTEEENIAAAALTNLRNCASVIQHTTLAH